VMVEYDALERWAQEGGVAFTGFASLLNAPEVAALIGEVVARANAAAPAGRRIAHFRLLDRNLAPEDPELTPMMKLRRGVVLERFGKLVEEMNRAA